jgi:uncharacterized damage-inducible protein DinB
VLQPGPRRFDFPTAGWRGADGWGILLHANRCEPQGEFIMDRSALDASLFALGFARQVTLTLLEDLPEDKWWLAPGPGLNHAAWILGHLAWTDDLFLTGVAGKPSVLPDGWSKTFGMKSTPTGDRNAYPAPAELRSALGRTREAITGWLRGLDAAAQTAPLPASFADFASCHATLGASLAWHEGLHTGQLTVVRRLAGLPPKIG